MLSGIHFGLVFEKTAFFSFVLSLQLLNADLVYVTSI